MVRGWNGVEGKGGAKKWGRKKNKGEIAKVGKRDKKKDPVEGGAYGRTLGSQGEVKEQTMQGFNESKPRN